MTNEHYHRVREYITQNKTELGVKRSRGLLRKLEQDTLTWKDDADQWIAGINFMLQYARGKK